MSYLYGYRDSSMSSRKPRLNEEGKAIFKAQMMDPPDFRIIIDCHTWVVHSKHLSSSGFFKKLLAGPFPESQSKSVTLHDDDPRNVVRLVTWLYHGAYSTSQTRSDFGAPSVSDMIASGQEQYKALPMTSRKASQPSKFLRPPPFDQDNSVHLAMYMLADKYDIPELRDYRFEQFRDVCSRDPSFVWSLEDVKKSLKKGGIKAEDFEALIDNELVSKPRDYLKHPKLKAKVEAKPDFAWKLVEKLGEDAGHLKRKRDYGTDSSNLKTVARWRLHGHRENARLFSKEASKLARLHHADRAALDEGPS